MTPEINLILSVNEEVKGADTFLSAEDFFFYEAFPSYLWFLKDLKKNQASEMLKKSIKSYYKRKPEWLKQELAKRNKDWKKIEKNYFQTVSKLFGGKPWPNKTYQGYGSIFNMYPRFIDRRVFAFPIGMDWAVNTIGHEMLHFMFFDHLKQEYKLDQNSKIPGKEDIYVWKLSEVFNNIIEEDKRYKKILNRKNNKPYPGCEKLYIKLLKQWEKNPDAIELIKFALS